MSLISIKKPISIELSIAEIDNYLPSLKMEVEVEIAHPTGNFIYRANDIWFECKEWDSFILSLQTNFSGSHRNASIQSMSDFFSIDIFSNDEKLTFSIKCEEPDIGDGIASFNFACVIDEDSFGHIKREFMGFDKWW